MNLSAFNQDVTPVYTAIIDNTNSVLSFAHSNGAAACWSLQQTTGPFSFQIINMNQPLFTLTRNGWLGLGTDTPRAPLDVSMEETFLGSVRLGMNQCDWNESSVPSGISIGHKDQFQTCPALFQEFSGNTRISGTDQVDVFVNDVNSCTMNSSFAQFHQDLYVTQKIGIGTTTPQSAPLS